MTAVDSRRQGRRKPPLPFLFSHSVWLWHFTLDKKKDLANKKARFLLWIMPYTLHKILKKTILKSDTSMVNIASQDSGDNNWTICWRDERICGVRARLVVKVIKNYTDFFHQWITVFSTFGHQRHSTFKKVQQNSGVSPRRIFEPDIY